MRKRPKQSNTFPDHNNDRSVPIADKGAITVFGSLPSLAYEQNGNQYFAKADIALQIFYFRLLRTEATFDKISALRKFELALGHPLPVSY